MSWSDRRNSEKERKLGQGLRLHIERENTKNGHLYIRRIGGANRSGLNGLCVTSGLNANRLYVDEFPDPVTAEFTSVAGLLDPAERQTWI
jgi:hypothetical protein